MQAIQWIIKWGSLLLLVAAGIAGIVLYKASVLALLEFFAFVIIYVQLPGTFLTDITGLSGNHLSTRLARGFFAGFALNIGLYFLTEYLGSRLLLIGVGPLLTTAFLILVIWRRIKGRDSGLTPAGLFRNLPASIFLFAVLCLIYAFIWTQYVYISPEFSSYASIRTDFGFHCGIMNALFEGFPALNPWVDGKVFHYHLFTEMLYAVAMRIFGLASETIIMSCAPYMTTFVFTVSLYSFFRETMQREDRIGLYCLGVLASNIFVVRSFDSSWFLYHVITNINSACLAVCGLLVVVPLLKVLNREDDSGGGRRWMAILFILVLTMLITGTKGPMGIVFVGSLGAAIVLGLFFKADRWEAIALMVASAAAFLVIYVVVIGTDHSSAGGGLINFGEMTDAMFYKDHLMDKMAAMGLPPLVRRAGVLGAFVVCYLTAFTLPFIVGYLRELILVFGEKKPYRIERVTVYACCAAGFLAMMILNYSGHSQVYFGFAATAFVPAVAYWFFEDLGEVRNFGIVLVRIIFILCMIVTSASLVLYFWEGLQEDCDYYRHHNEVQSKYRGVSDEEYDAMIWLKNYTDQDALIASDRYYSVAPEEYDYKNRWDSLHLLYAVYSQRRQYLEGSGFSIGNGDSDLRLEMIQTNEKLYDRKNKARGDLARELGVDYVVVSKRFNEPGDLANKDYELCYQNRDIDIYEIIQ